MITQRSVMLGFVGFCFYLIALVNSLPAFYYALTWLTVGLLFTSLGIALLSLVGLDMRWDCENAHGVESLPGEEENAPRLNLFLANKGSFNKTSIIVEVSLVSMGGAYPAGETTIQRFVVEALASGTSLQTLLPLRTLPRGRWKIVQIKVTGSDILGLFRTSRKQKIPLASAPEILVGPGLVRPPRSAGQSGKGSGKRAGEVEARYKVGLGEDLRGTRPYAPGDDLRRVHWKSTARLGELVVKEHHERGRDAVVLVWDGALGTDWGHGAATEWALRVVFSSFIALSRMGGICDVACQDAGNQVLKTAAGTVTYDQVLALLTEASATREKLHGDTSTYLPGEYHIVYLVSASLAPDLVQLVEKCVARRVMVRVVLLDGYAFAEEFKGWGFGIHRQTAEPVQKVQVRDAEGAWSEQLLPPSSHAFAQQYQALQNAGAKVTLLRPTEADLQNPAPAIQAAVQFLMGEGPPMAPVEMELASAN